MSLGLGNGIFTQQKNVSTAGLLTGADNGLQVVGTEAYLGGNLLIDTEINLGGYIFNINEQGIYDLLTIDPAGLEYKFGDIDGLNNNSYLWINDGAPEITANIYGSSMLYLSGPENTLGDRDNYGNGTVLIIDDINETVQFNSGGVIGNSFLEFNHGSTTYTYGDIDQVNNGCTAELNDSQRQFVFQRWGAKYLDIDITNQLYQIGDIDFVGDGNYLSINNLVSLSELKGLGKTGMSLDFANDVYQIGEIGGLGNGTAVTIDDIAKDVTITANDGLRITTTSGVMLILANALANGAGAAAGTLLNAPAAGNPTKWIPIDDGGTTRHIPAW